MRLAAPTLLPPEGWEPEPERVPYRHPEVAAQGRCACGGVPDYYVVGVDGEVTDYCSECGDAESA
ncbi:MAG: hypothetical protein OXG69_14760 [bacterium]|nr:hypothetical protein [bacterium]